MNINFENLERIEEIHKIQLIILKNLKSKNEKRWLSTIEAAQYLGYSKDSIDFFVKKGEFILGIHYYQKERKRIFDKEVLDKWVIGIDNNQIEVTIENIISSIDQ